MEIRVRFNAGVIVFNIAGRLVTGSTPSLRACISELATSRRATVLIHMAAVTDMDAHAIGELVWSLTSIERHGGQMAIIAPSRFVRHLLAITRLDTVIAIYDTELEALVKICPDALTAAAWGNGFEHSQSQLCI